MKKIAEKVALIAQICITFIFVLTNIFMLTGVIKINDAWLENNRFVVVIVIVMAAVYLGLSLYMVYMHFSENNALKNILLYSTHDNTVRAVGRVVRKTAKQSAKLVEGVKLKGVQIRPDDKLGFKMKAVIALKVDNAEFCTDKLRFVLADSFKNILGLKFSTIDFKIVNMQSAYAPDVQKAEQEALKLEEERLAAAKEEEAKQAAKKAEDALSAIGKAQSSENPAFESDEETAAAQDDSLNDSVSLNEDTLEDSEEKQRRNLKA